MNSLLEQLQSREAILLMYLADELDTGEKSQVEQMLGTDAALCAELADLRGLDASLAGTLAPANFAGSTAPSGNEDAAVQSLMREFRRREIMPANVQPAARLQATRRPWYAYPIAAAAAILLGFLAWWGNQPAHQISPTPGPMAVAVTPAVPETPSTLDLAKAAAQLPASTADLDTSADGPLAVADQQLNDLSSGNNDFGFPAP